MEMHIHERVHGLITAAVDTHTLRVIRPTYFYSATFSVLSGLYAPEMSANFNRFFSTFLIFIPEKCSSEDSVGRQVQVGPSVTPTNLPLSSEKVSTGFGPAPGLIEGLYRREGKLAPL